MAVRGSEPGERRGGRKKGTPSKATAAREAKIAASGLTPLDYMLTIMRDESKTAERRDEMAKLAAPYVHPKPAPVPVPSEALHPAGHVNGNPAIELPDFSDPKVPGRQPWS